MCMRPKMPPPPPPPPELPPAAPPPSLGSLGEESGQYKAGRARGVSFGGDMAAELTRRRGRGLLTIPRG